MVASKVHHIVLVMTMTRKYKIGLTNQSGSREMYIETDDLAELGSIRWVREYLQPSVASQDAQDTLVMSSLQEQNASLRLQVSQLRQQIQSMAPQQPQQPRQQAPVQPVQPRRIPTSFLELDPNNMTADVWSTLGEEQRVQWMKQWNIQ